MNVTAVDAEKFLEYKMAHVVANLPPVKIHCSILAEDAIKAAVEDYKKKHDIII